MDSLTEGELHALRNLADKQTGNATAFVNIADARRLTEFGLAIRSRQGWDITPAGTAHLSALDRPNSDSAPPELVRPAPESSER
jgi:hypothetical protein